jgi:hypothetical protein
LAWSLRWRRLAAGGPDDQAALATEIGRRLGQPDYRPPPLRDPIAHWIEQDCGQPPSLAGTDYRSLRTFGGATFRKPTKGSDQKRRTSALWFSRHHRGGGGAMLHHRTLTPVIPRDWATKLEMFTSALALTANTDARPAKGLSPKEQTAGRSANVSGQNPRDRPFSTPPSNPSAGSNDPNHASSPDPGHGFRTSTVTTTARSSTHCGPPHHEGRHVTGQAARTRWRTTATTATFPAAVRETEEVVPVNVSTWVLPSGVTVGR